MANYYLSHTGSEIDQLLNAIPVIETTYANLVSLRNENNLVPGASYRIIDYVTTVTKNSSGALKIFCIADLVPADIALS